MQFSDTRPRIHSLNQFYDMIRPLRPARRRRINNIFNPKTFLHRFVDKNERKSTKNNIFANV